ncbi:hypothetical protein NVX01_004590 [Salmonella enterica]|nr:hypothetical protein [Salmonella enterica]
MANVVAVSELLTAGDEAVKLKIDAVVTSYKGAANEFAGTFIALCERFINKDSQSGDNLQHLLEKLGDDQEALRTRVKSKLEQFSNDTLSVTYDKGKDKWSVVTKKKPKLDKDGKPVYENGKRVYTKESLFDKEAFQANISAAKATKNALTYVPGQEPETDEQRKERLEAKKKERYFKAVKSGAAEKEVKDELVTLANALLEVEKDLTPARLAVKLESMVKDVLLQVKPVIDGETE